MSRMRLTNPFRSTPRKRRSSFALIEKINPSKIGAPPGTPIHVGLKPEFDPFITAIRFSDDQVEEWLHIDIAGLQSLTKNNDRALWVDIEGVHDVNLVTQVSHTLDLHPLTSEDVVNCHLRPQFESYPDYFFFALKMIYLGPEDPSLAGGNRPLISEHVSLILKGQTLATFQEKPGDIFGRIRDRIRTKTGKIEAVGPTICCMRCSMPSSMAIFKSSISLPNGSNFSRTNFAKDRATPTSHRFMRSNARSSGFGRRSSSARSAQQSASRTECLSGNTRIYLRDLSDHVSQVTDSLSLSMEMISVLVDTWHSMTNQKMNAIMKTLTMISTVFLPLNFIAGIYGMNFVHMPELQYEHGYYTVVAAMFMVAFGIVGFFVYKGWLWERPERRPESLSKN